MPSSSRRVRFAIIVIVSQLLLIALAIAWVVQMSMIAMNGSIYFVEANPIILWAEIVATILITLFATAVFTLQIYRLSERRRGDRGERRRDSSKGKDSRD